MSCLDQLAIYFYVSFGIFTNYVTEQLVARVMLETFMREMLGSDHVPS
jgi:hypothetical protein